ncbi:HAMP domain-containing sensor histidine kinase [Propionicimonas sp.]|uniref:sensor histidine kinase n=2 Tax=Propionicimonas sp. TaxID=1955623 RepID=UPI0025F21370|nr:HAMP domain-containing sensor histidine kinase [Propionicimonas sp.]
MTLANPTVPPTPSPMGKGTLSRQLVLRVTALVALLTVALGLFTSLASFQILQRELDDRLQTAIDRRFPDGDNRRPGDLTGSGVIRIDTIDGQKLLTSSLAVTDEAAQQLLALPASPDPVNVRLDDLGLYRVLVRDRPSYTLVALPLSEVTKPLTSQLVMTALLTAAMILATYLATRRVVETSLRPLNRLTATATQVSNLPLERGEGQVPIRVAPADANPTSEVGRVGLAFNHMLDNVEGALAARHRSETKVRQFVADASHELRNPLASIRGYAELTRRGSDELPEDSAYALSRIESESDRMSALVEDLLLLARLDSQPTLDLQPVDVTEIVLNTVSDARAADSEHKWSLDLPEDVITAMADPHRLHQVVANLLANARTHTPAGTAVETTLRAADGFAEVSVTDNGPGVPTEIQSSVFERFTRADVSRVRQQGGSSTGLGLAIVAAVMKAHGGEVRLDSRPGYTRFTVRVPLA